MRDLLSLLWVPHPSVLRVGCLFRCTPPAAPWLFYGRINALRYSRYVPAFAHELVALGLGTLCILLGGFYAAPTKVPALVLPLPRIERLSGCPMRRCCAWGLYSLVAKDAPPLGNPVVFRSKFPQPFHSHNTSTIDAGLPPG